MGAPMARNLHKAGLLEAVWNRSHDKAATLAQRAGRRRARDPRRIRPAGRRRGDLCLGRRGCAHASSKDWRRDSRRGALVIDCSTVSADTARWAESFLAGRGVRFVDAPVSGGVEGAKNGTLAIMCGGEPAAFDAARPVLAAMGKTIEHFGPSGSGQATKATNQIMCAGIIRACAEAMAFAGAHQLPLDRVVATLGAGAGSSWYFVHRAPNMIRESYPAGFRVKLHAKDLRHLPRHGGAFRRLAAGGRFDARRICRADRARLRRRGHLGHASPQAGVVQGRGAHTHERRRARPAAQDVEASVRQLYLPDFCRARAVLAIVIICELTALVLALARNEVALGFWPDLARTSMFLLWIGLFGAGDVVRAARLPEPPVAGQGIRHRAGAHRRAGDADLHGRVLVRRAAPAGSKATRMFPQDHWTFLVRNVVIALVVTALALRYFYVTHEWRHNVELQARARVHALQARIRPHFLFNSMNTIAALTRSNPARAEEAVQDLADLFRANLNEKRNEIPLAEEIDVARTYQRMEQLRLGDRLRVEWKIDSLPQNALVPGLTLQPLLENAIYHGVEPRPDGGVVTVVGEFNKGMITIVVRNPLPAANRHHARWQSPGARQHQGTAGSHVRRTRHGQGRALRRRIHRDAALPLPAHRRHAPAMNPGP